MGTILWIEDDYEMIQGLIRPLEQSGHEIDPARTISSALEKLHGNVAYELVVMDIILPSYESTQASWPERIRLSLDAGHEAGEGLIDYMRVDLGLRIPIVVMSVIADDSWLRSRLEPYEISDFLAKGRLTPTQVKDTVERVLNEFNM